MESTDDGMIWSNMVEISAMVTEPEWGFIGTGPPGGIQLPSGRLIICMRDTVTIMQYTSYITSL